MKSDLTANPASCASNHCDGAIQLLHKNSPPDLVQCNFGLLKNTSALARPLIPYVIAVNSPTGASAGAIWRVSVFTFEGGRGSVRRRGERVACLIARILSKFLSSLI